MLRNYPVLAAMLFVSTASFAVVRADEPKPAASNPSVDQADAVSLPADSWGLTLSNVPTLLRMHVPALQGHAGRVVQTVQPQSPAANKGLLPGDVILRINAAPITSSSPLPPPSEVSQMMVVRRGRVMPLPRRSWTQPMPFPGPRPLPGPYSYPKPLDPGLSPLRGMGPYGGASATAIATGGESVSVSQVGDRIVLEIQSPTIGPGQLRLQGTRQQILQELDKRNLSPAAKQKVLSALR